MRPYESHACVSLCDAPNHLHQLSWALVAADSAIIKHTRTRRKGFTTAWATDADKHEYGDTCESTRHKNQNPNAEQ